MLDKPLSDLDAWVAYVSRAEIPVLRRTARAFAVLREREDAVTVRDLASVIAHDPLMALKLLAHIEANRRSTQTTDLTTIDRAVMMLGVTPFFSTFEQLPQVEDVLGGQPQALLGLLKVMARARQASLYARDWAVVRHDVDCEEIALAALLHDTAEILLWCHAPALMLRVRDLQESQRGLRSAAAQQRVLGIRLHDLQLALVKEWRLPALLQTLMNDSQAEHPRVRNVVYAVNLARHSQKGWDDPALPDDYAAAEKLLGITREMLLERIARVAQQPPAAGDALAGPPPS